MSKQKLRVKNTQLDNLISNLRGEVGEIIASWVLLRHMLARERQLTSDDFAKDLANENLAFVSMLRDKLADEIVARLSELAEAKVGRLTFHFAAVKLAKLDNEVGEFGTFISRRKFHEKRNYNISHKELPEEWSQHKDIAIPYRILLRTSNKTLFGGVRVSHTLYPVNEVPLRLTCCSQDVRPELAIRNNLKRHKKNGLGRRWTLVSHVETASGSGMGGPTNSSICPEEVPAD